MYPIPLVCSGIALGLTIGSPLGSGVQQTQPDSWRPAFREALAGLRDRVSELSNPYIILMLQRTSLEWP